MNCSLRIVVLSVAVLVAMVSATIVTSNKRPHSSLTVVPNVRMESTDSPSFASAFSYLFNTDSPFTSLFNPKTYLALFGYGDDRDDVEPIVSSAPAEGDITIKMAMEFQNDRQKKSAFETFTALFNLDPEKVLDYFIGESSDDLGLEASPSAEEDTVSVRIVY